MVPYELEVELCHAQYWVPKPLELFPVAVLITYWVVVLLPAAVLPKCAAAAMASLASCDWVGLLGAAAALSYQMPARTPVGFPAWVPLEPQKTVPEATPSQYWVVLLAHELPPTPLKKLCWMAASPLGSLLFHCVPQ